MRYKPLQRCSRGYEIDCFPYQKIYRHLNTRKLVGHCMQCNETECLIPVKLIKSISDIYFIIIVLCVLIISAMTVVIVCSVK